MSGVDQLVESREKIIACDDTDADPITHAVLARHVAHGFGARRRIHATGVRDDAHATLHDSWQHTLDGPDEITRVTHLWVTFLLLLQNAHRDFGEIVEHQVVDVAALDLSPRRLEPVTP